MLTLSRTWTWLITILFPLGITAVLYDVGAFRTDPVRAEILISAGTLNLLATLLALSAVLMVWARFMRVQRKKGQDRLIPLFLNLEDEENQSVWVGRSVLFACALFFLACLFVFGSRFSRTEVFAWNAQTPLADGFFESRSAAWSSDCVDEPCFAVAQRVLSGTETLTGVIQYTRLFPDAFLFVALILAVWSGWMVLREARR